MAVKGKGKGKGKDVVDAKAAASLPAAVASASSSGGKRKRPPLLAASPSSSGARGSGSAPRKRGRASASRFIDDAAVDDDGDDSDEFDDDGGEGDSAEEDDELMSAIWAGVKDVKRAGKSNIPFFLKEEMLSGDELEEFVQERYGHGSDHVTYDEDDKEFDERKSLLHSADDPTIWRVRCMVGHERHIVFCLIQKYVALHNIGSDLPIISAFSLEHVKGYVYIEADKEHDVVEACKGFCNLYTSKINLVPINEVPRLLSIQNKSIEIAKGTWVRIKSGKYKGDLAQVVAVDHGRKKVTVKLVPRVDLQALAKKFGGGISLKKAALPDPRLISYRELEDFRPHIKKKFDSESGEFFDILDGLMLKDGYLYKKVSIFSLNCFGVQPSSSELIKFEPAKKDEPQDAEFISHLCGGRKRNSLGTFDDSLEDKGSEYKLHDLVMFGRKDFGVIIAMKSDSFQILKGDAERAAVVTVLLRDIKNSCVDTMFRASDSHMKTICINDTVKVLGGPLKDRQGIVRHMYKGSLFIYDEENTENCGFFCAKSELCVVMKEDCPKKKGDRSYNIGSKEPVESSSIPQSPMERDQQRDDDSGFKRCRQGDRDQPFTVGQTLRIRVGPLKGYLCRVVRIYRSDVTVKLDSLVKLITVNCNHLSDANIKSYGSTRDDTTSKCDQFGYQESLSKGGLLNEDIGVPPSKSSWEFEPSSSNRVSWPGLSTLGSSSAGGEDNGVDKDQGGDPWGSKVTSRNESQEGHTWNASSQPSVVDDWTNWTNAEKSTENKVQGDDAWGGKVASGHGLQAEHPDIGGSEIAKVDGWSHCASAEKSTEGKHETWRGNNADEDERGGWTKATSSNRGQADSWGRGAGTSMESEGKGDWGSHIGRPGHFEAGQGIAGDWANETSDSSSKWDKQEKLTELEHKNRKGDFANDGETGSWSRATLSNHGQPDSWNKGTGRSGKSDGKVNWGVQPGGQGHFEAGQGFSKWADVTVDCWHNKHETEKLALCGHEKWKEISSRNENETGNWNRATSNNVKADSWNKGGGASGESNDNRWDPWGGDTVQQGSSEVGQGFVSSWSKTKSDCDKTEKSTEGERDSWKENKASDGETGGWSKASSSCHDQSDGQNKQAGSIWEDGGIADWGDHSDRQSFGVGQGFGRGRGGGGRGNSRDTSQDGGWNKMRYVGGHSSAWGGGRTTNSDSDWSGGKQDCWNRSRESDGGRGRGRGRGFNVAGRGRSQEDNWRGSGYSANSFGSGRGRGRRGRGSWEAGGNSDYDNDSLNFGRDVKDQSYGWKSNQESLGLRDFSGGTSYSWKSDQISSWGKDKDHSWGERKSFAGGCSGWSSRREDHGASRNEGVTGEGVEKLNMNQGHSWNSGWDGDKVGVSDKHIDDQQHSSWQKEATNKWSATEVSQKKQSSWNHAAGTRENVDVEDWSIKPKPFRADQSGGDASASAGHQPSTWASKSAENEKDEKDGGCTEEPTWNIEKGKDWNKPKGSGTQHSAWDSLGEHGPSSNVAAGDNWKKGSRFPERKNDESGDWHTAKTLVPGSLDWGQKSSGIERGKDAGSSGSTWDNPKPSGRGSSWSSQEFGGGNWNSPKPGSGGKQASDWNNPEGSNWNKPKQFGSEDSSGWTIRSAEDGARGNDDHRGDWNAGKAYGGDQSSGWKGNMPSGRGNGRGKSFGRDQQLSGWARGRHANEEAGCADFPESSGGPKSYGRGKPAGWTQDTGSGSRGGGSGWNGGRSFAGEPSWNAKNGANDEGWRPETKGAWGGWDSETGDQPTGSANRSEWNNTAMSSSGWASCKLSDSKKPSALSSWDKPKGSDSNTATGWNSWSQAAKLSALSSWDKLKGSDSNTATGWNSSSQEAKLIDSNQPSALSSRDQPKISDSNPATGWKSLSQTTRETMAGEGDQAGNQKRDFDKPDGPGCWGNNNAPCEEAGQSRSQGDAWSREDPCDGGHVSDGRNSWERAKDGSAGKGGW